MADTADTQRPNIAVVSEQIKGLSALTDERLTNLKSAVDRLGELPKMVYEMNVTQQDHETRIDKLEQANKERATWRASILPQVMIGIAGLGLTVLMIVEATHLGS